MYIFFINFYYSSIRFLRDLWDIYTYPCNTCPFVFFLCSCFFQISLKVIIVNNKKKYSRENMLFHFCFHLYHKKNQTQKVVLKFSHYHFRLQRMTKKSSRILQFKRHQTYLDDDVKNYMMRFENFWMDKIKKKKKKNSLYIYIETVFSFVLISPGTLKGTCERTN